MALGGVVAQQLVDLPLLPMSTPRVGSSSTRAAGRATMAAAMATFCWLPPRERADGRASVACLDPEPSRSSWRWRPCGRGAATPTAPVISSSRRDTMLSPDGHVREQARGCGPRRRTRRRRATPTGALAGRRPSSVARRPLEAGDGADELAGAGALDPHERDRPGPRAPRGRRRGTPRRDATSRAARSAGLAPSPSTRRGTASSRAAPPPTTSSRAIASWVRRVALEHRGAAPVEDDGHPVGVLAPAPPAGGDTGSPPGRPSASACIRRNRSSDSSSVRAELGSSNRNTRASWTRARAISVRWWMASGTIPSGSSATSSMARSRITARSVVVQPVPQPPGALAADHHVLADGQVGEQLRLLVDHGDAVDADVHRPRLAVDQDLALVGRDLGGEDLDHGALAGAVGAGHAQDLARVGRQVQAVERDGVAVALAQPPDPDARPRRSPASSVRPMSPCAGAG